MSNSTASLARKRVCTLLTCHTKSARSKTRVNQHSERAKIPLKQRKRKTDMKTKTYYRYMVREDID